MCCPILWRPSSSSSASTSGSDHIRGFSELPRFWTTSHHSQLGRSAQPGRTSVHGDGPLAGALAGALSDDCRLLPQHVRRCPQGPVRPPTARRRGQLRRRNGKTHTRIPLQTDQPFQMVNGQKEPVPFSFLRIAVFLLRQVWTIGKNQAQIIYSFFRPGFFIVLTLSSPIAHPTRDIAYEVNRIFI